MKLEGQDGLCTPTERKGDPGAIRTEVLDILNEKPPRPFFTGVGAVKSFAYRLLFPGNLFVWSLWRLVFGQALFAFPR